MRLRLGMLVLAVGASVAGLVVAQGQAARPVICLGKRATIVGTAKADTLRGTPRADVIAGLGGNDRLVGLGGNDLLCGGPGNDSADGGPGKNTCADVEHRKLCPVPASGATGGTTSGGTSGSTTIAGTTFTFGAEVPAATRSEVENAVAEAKSFVQSRMGLATSAFEVFGYGTVDTFIAAYSAKLNPPPPSLQNVRSTLTQIQGAGGGYAETSTGVVFLWTASTPPGRSLGLTIAHEYFHVVQLQLSPQNPAQPPDRVRANGPEWLAEGSAEYVGQQVAGNYGAALAAAVSRMRAEHPALSKLETPAGFRSIPNPFPICMLAVDQLVKDAGTASLTAFWRSTGQGTPWQQAFQQAFGRTVGAFYAELAAAYA
jgi:hypothetical protein